MNSVLNTLTAQSGAIILALTLAVIALAILLIQTRGALKAIQRRWITFLPDGRGQEFESMLTEHAVARKALAETVSRHESRVQELEALAQTSKRHVGLVRYDAFDDVGGEQSFALAIYDDHGDGAVVSAVVGRADCRVYCKPLKRGQSDRQLSKEESRAVRQPLDTLEKPG